MRRVLEVILKKFQSYSFIIFLVLIFAAFFALNQINNANNTNLNDNQNDNDSTTNFWDYPWLDDDDSDDTTQTSTKEVLMIPMAVDKSAVIVRPFYDITASEEEQVNAIVKYGNTYVAHSGVNYSSEDSSSFNVLAALSGTVSKVENSTLRGYTVEINHGDDLITVYQSLSTVVVKEGDIVAQGDVLGKSGSNEFDVESGNHVHFQVIKNGKYLNPKEEIGKALDEITE